jgi:lipid-binding SYLF domain-containing protein
MVKVHITDGSKVTRGTRVSVVASQLGSQAETQTMSATGDRSYTVAVRRGKGLSLPMASDHATVNPAQGMSLTRN